MRGWGRFNSGAEWNGDIMRGLNETLTPVIPRPPGRSRVYGPLLVASALVISACSAGASAEQPPAVWGGEATTQSEVAADTQPEARTPISRILPPIVDRSPDIPRPVEPAPPPTSAPTPPTSAPTPPTSPPSEPQTVTYRVDGSVLLNPERGWYEQDAPFWQGTQRGVHDMSRLRADGVTMIRLYFLIDEYLTSPIDAEALDLIEANFTEARESGVKIIPRFAYNFPTNSDYRDAQDADLETTLAHIGQLEPILTRNSDVIAYMNLGFVGAWGEWHSSSNNHVGPNRSLNDGARRIIDEIMQALPADRMATMRYPDYKRQLYGGVPLSADNAHNGSPQARMGHLNDCLLASDTDWGTYPGNAAEREEIKQFLSADNQFLVMGGETCNEGADAQPHIGCANALSELERMRWSALHNGYHQGVLDGWKDEGCYDDIGRQLGYRFELVSGTYPRTAQAGGTMNIELALRNAGFAAPYNPRSVDVIFRNRSTGAETAATVAADPRTWTPGDHRLAWSVSVPSGLAAGDYSLLLNLADPEPTLADRADYSIRVANLDTWEAGTGYNDLGITIAVD